MRHGGARRNINIQDGQLFSWLKESTPLAFELITGKTFVGTIFRFDRFALLVRVDAGEVLIYKSAIACILAATSATKVRSPHHRRQEPQHPRRVAYH